MQAVARLPAELLLKEQGIRVAFFDVDGVFTDGGLYFSARGETIKRFHVLDGYGIGMLRASNIVPVVITGRATIPTDAVAVVANVTAVRPGADGWLAAVPCDVAEPTTASLNYRAGVTISNEIIAPLGDDGTLCIDASTAIGLHSNA